MYQPLILTRQQDKYYELPPHPDLRQLIQTFWVSPTNDSFNRILPDFCGDIILVLSENLIIEKTFFTTPQTDYFIYEEDEQYLTIGVRFYLHGLPLILTHPLSGQKNTSLQETDYFSDFSAEFKPFDAFSNLSSLFEQLNIFFLNRLSTMAPFKSEALLTNFMASAFNRLSYREAIRKEVLSERSIQRKFKHDIGLSPYELFDSIRFQQILQEIKRGKKTFVDLAYDYHFHDQSHFSKTIKKHSGLSPKQIALACRDYTRNPPPF